MDCVKKEALLVKLLFLAFVLLTAYMLFAGWELWYRRLYCAMSISEVLFLTAVLKMMPLMELSLGDLTALAFFMQINQLVLQILYVDRLSFFHIVPFIFFLLLELVVLVKRVHKRKRGYGIGIGYAVLCCLGVLFVYQQWEQFILNYYLIREGEFGYAVKILYLIVSMAIIVVPVFLAVCRLSVFMKRWLVKLQEYSITYTEIDRSVILIMTLTLGTLSMRELVRILVPFVPQPYEIHWIPSMPAENTPEIPMLWIGLSVMMVLIQVIYIRLLVKSISVKEEMRLQEKDLRLLAEYNRELEKNMEDMRGIRHDIKNMFLTMGGFVDRSNDEEMKLFYEENFVPFAKQELQKNDLCMKLACIHSESLKSFLYFKMMQGIEQRVSIDLLVQIGDTNDILCMEQIDLPRILGILMDNAIEEAKACSGTVVIAIKENEREYLFSVSNTVRRQIREKGVIAGTTDKGLGRGNGLLIVESLIRKYRNVILNSFFKEDEFVQCLRIEK